MIGVVIATHGNLANELLETAKFIIGDVSSVTAVTLAPSASIETIQKNIKDAIREVDKGRGVIILTDMFGGTPSNIALSFLEKGKVDVITGVNLPMLIKFMQSAKDERPLEEVAADMVEYARKSISHANAILS